MDPARGCGNPSPQLTFAASVIGAVSRPYGDIVPNGRGTFVHKILSGIIATSVFLLVAETALAAQAAKKKIPKLPPPSLTGIASVYKYKKPRRSASGEILNFNRLVAAHRTFRFGTKVRVTNRRNGKSVVVRIIDRGPFIRGRVIDLSPAAAREIGLGWGLAPVTLAVVGNKA
ncbi:MAG TPA: septal ring lytic transglycosylase RlpA family protein [Xanthobacteraceae bacterium]|nr:septal ring lytic transglycosylase RlpA family protein [Xanthobacteraceae bacterium]